MSFFKQRFAGTDLSGHPFHPVLGDEPVDDPGGPASPSSATVRQPPEPSSSELNNSVDDTGSFSWTGPSSLTPEELMTDRRIGAGLPLRKLAAGWLREYLSEGQRSQSDVEIAARGRDGIGITTLRRAKFDLGVVSIKESISGYWVWALLEDEELADPGAPKCPLNN